MIVFDELCEVGKIKRGLDLGHNSSNYANVFVRIVPMTIHGSWPSYMTK